MVGADTLPRLGFRLHRQGARVESSVPGPDGAKELWLLADRRQVPDVGAAANTEIATVIGAAVA